ncbi:MAG TPA: AarF/ABC1/UbiB kinase family protein [Myxococcota bacterium]|nr:AarF/ABC1/UbiB kinase family protein [Myxococcota bacterium]HOD07222.1 AarF/ABC1/UbiB kinase family protein [Myxococcota bacterium]
MWEFHRIREIAVVLSRYGFDDLAQRLGLVGALRRAAVAISGRQQAPRLSEAVRLRLAITDLGPTFVKLGQMLASHPELLPPEFITEFKKFHDDVPPFPIEQAREVIERETGHALDDIFQSFDDVPLAAASIGQVHTGVLKDGRKVAVKIRRPGIESRVEADLRIMRRVALMLSRSIPAVARMDAVSVVDEFRRNLMMELDFFSEVRNMIRYRDMMSDEPGLLVPSPIEELCTSQVIVMDFVDGIKITDTAAIEAAGVDIRKVVETGMRVMLRSIFEHGFFHSDPHPGNFFVMADSRVVLLDYGTVGTVDPRRIDEMISFVYALSARDVDGLMNVLIDMEIIDDDTDVRSLRIELASLMGRYMSVSLKEIRVATFANDIFAVARRHQIRLPADMLMIAKAMTIMEGIGTEVCPDFRPVEFIGPYFKQFYIDRMLDTDKQGRSMTKVVADGLTLLKDAPYDVRRILRRMRMGEHTLVVRAADEKQARRDRYILVNRVLFASLALAFFVISAVFVDSSRPFGHVAGIVSAILSPVFFLSLLISMAVYRGRSR